MKKLISIAILLMFAVSAHAAVTFSGTASGNTCTLNYSVSGPNSVRSFALDITLSSGTITGVTCSNASYYIYPGSIVISSGSVAATGTCVCDATKFPGKGQGGIGTAGVTVEMGSLYTGSSKPASSGTLLTFAFSTSPMTATIAANVPRGGIVMENPDESAGSNLPITIPGGCAGGCDCTCYAGTHCNDYVAMGYPGCWCSGNNPRQCHGDATGTRESTKNNYWVGPGDLAIMLAAWQKTPTQIQGQTTNGIMWVCADFDQSEQSSKNHYRVGATDLGILLANWQKSNLPLPDCP